jgi:hypothetical protein
LALLSVDRDVLNRLEALLDPQNLQASLRSSLTSFVRDNAGKVDAYVTEYDAAQPGTGSSNTGWTAQTRNTEIIHGFMVSVPADSTNVVLKIGELVLPLTTAYPGSSTTSLVHTVSNLGWVVRGQHRSLTYTSASTTIGSTCLVWGIAAPAAGAPGILV